MKSIAVQTQLNNGQIFKTNLTYEVFGPSLGSAPIVLVNHALTGNSSVTGERGWWNQLIGENLTIDTLKYTILAFNIPGNGYDGFFIDDYKSFRVKNISTLFLNALEQLEIKSIFAAIGGSLGGAIAWQMAYDSPHLFQHLIPIVTDFQTTDWVRAQSFLQDRILNYSENPIENARINAMLVYRTPESIDLRFKNQWNANKNVYQVEDWLDYHGNALKKRFALRSYKLMNHLISTVWVANEFSELKRINSDIHIVAVNSDLFFSARRNKETYEALKPLKANTYYYEIQSIHGHDAFLMEFEQLNHFIHPIFK